MAREYEPVVGQWYEDLEDKESFRVLTVNEDEELVEIEYLEGDIEEIDLETWQELDLEKIDEPEGWSEGAFEKDDDDDEDLDEEWDEDEDEDDDDEEDEDEDEEEAGSDY